MDKRLPEGEGAADDAARAYASGLRFLACRPRSMSEMRRRLGRQYSPHIVDSTIQLLERAALLDDAKFAAYWVDQRQQFSPRGTRALRAELRAKGLPPTLVDVAIEAAGPLEEESAYRAGLRHVRKLSTADGIAFSRSLTGFLARRGFGPSTIRGTVRRLWNAAHEGTVAGSAGAISAGASRNPLDLVG